MEKELTKADLIRIWLWIDFQMQKILNEQDLKKWWENPIPSLANMTPKEALRKRPGGLVRVVKSYFETSYS